ncbi:DMT family transporter [Mycobacterium sp. BMJ-28]
MTDHGIQTSFAATTLGRFVVLAAAIAAEVGATLSLRASQDHQAWIIAVVAGYTVGFILLTLLLRGGMSVSVVYGLWGACGTAATAMLGAALFGDPFTWLVVAGIAMIIVGVVLVEVGSRPAGTFS